MAADVRIGQEEIETNGSLRRTVLLLDTYDRVWLRGRRRGCRCFVRQNDRGSRFNDDRAGARGSVVPGVGRDVVDGVRCYL